MLIFLFFSQVQALQLHLHLHHHHPPLLPHHLPHHLVFLNFPLLKISLISITNLHSHPHPPPHLQFHCHHILHYQDQFHFHPYQQYPISTLIKK